MRMATAMIAEVNVHHVGDGFGRGHFSLSPLRVELLTVAENEPFKAKKRVRFSENHQVSVLDPAYYQPRYHAIKWWTVEELQQIRQNAKDICQSLRHVSGSSPNECDLTMAFRKTTFMLTSNLEPLLKMPPTSPEQDLRAWCTHEDGRRGLERFGSRDYCQNRKRDVQNIRQVVLGEYQRQRETNCYNDEYLSSLSREATRRLRTFALFIGEADALVAGTTDPAAPIRRTPPRKRSKSDKPYSTLL